MQDKSKSTDGGIWCCGKLFFADIVNGRTQLECSECACMWAVGQDGTVTRLGVGPNLVLVPRPQLSRTVPLIPTARNGSVTRKNKLA